MAQNKRKQKSQKLSKISKNSGSREATRIKNGAVQVDQQLAICYPRFHRVLQMMVCLEKKSERR